MNFSMIFWQSKMELRVQEFFSPVKYMPKSSPWIEFLQAHKGKLSGLSMDQKRAMYTEWKSAHGIVTASKPRTKSNCAGKAQKNCLPPCRWASGAKRQYCHAVGVRKAGPAKPKKTSGSPKKAVKKGPKGPRGKLPAALHGCKTLGQNQCDVAPNCYWQQGKGKRKPHCATRSGKPVVNAFQGPARQAMLSQIRGQHGGYWW